MIIFTLYQFVFHNFFTEVTLVMLVLMFLLPFSHHINSFYQDSRSITSVDRSWDGDRQRPAAGKLIDVEKEAPLATRGPPLPVVGVAGVIDQREGAFVSI